MKKMILTIAAMLSTVLTYAGTESAAAAYENLSAYDMTVNMRKFGEALSLTDEQAESVAEIHRTFSAEMRRATRYDADERTKRVNKAINKDLAYMHYVLSHDQYRKYLMLLNVTLANRGLR